MNLGVQRGNTSVSVPERKKRGLGHRGTRRKSYPSSRLALGEGITYGSATLSVLCKDWVGAAVWRRTGRSGEHDTVRPGQDPPSSGELRREG
jgi:hypothetical protein